MLDDNLKAQLSAYLEYLRQPIRITASLDESEASTEMRALLAELAAASTKVEVVEAHDASVRTPSFAIHTPGEAPRVRFAGLPLGHEFTSLVLALLHVGGHPPKVSDEELAAVARLSKPLRFETYFSQSCQSCPDVVQALNLMAAKNPNIEHVAIEGSLFQEEVTA